MNNLSHRKAKSILLKKYGNRCLADDCAWDFSKIAVNVQLEHIDGNSSNNNLSNLTLLCPNCHSCTSTYKGRNKGSGLGRTSIMISKFD